MAFLLLNWSLNWMRPIVPYPIVPMSKTAQMPVMMPPMGKIRIFMPGTMNGASLATTRVWMGGCTTVLLTVPSRANMPETKEASSDLSVALTWKPAALNPVSVTVGARSFSSSLLQKIGVLVSCYIGYCRILRAVG